MIRKVSIGIALAWPLGFALALNLPQLRSGYVQLKSDHASAQQSANGASPSTGERLQDLFEYTSAAQADYLFALEAWVLLGLAPSILILTMIAFRRSTESNLSTAGASSKRQGEVT